MAEEDTVERSEIFGISHYGTGVFSEHVCIPTTHSMGGGEEWR